MSVVDRERAERRARATRPPGRCASTTSRSRCRWTPASGGAATCSPRCAPRSAPTGPASTSRRTPRARPSRNCTLRAEQVVEWATRGGARALGLDGVVGQPRGGQEGRRRPDQERPLAGDVPDAQPLRPRRLPGAARRRAHRARQRPGREARRTAWSASTCAAAPATRSSETVEYLRSALGEEAWEQGMNPEVPETQGPRQPVPVHRVPQQQHARPMSTAPERGRHRRVPVPAGAARPTSAGQRGRLRRGELPQLRVRAAAGSRRARRGHPAERDCPQQSGRSAR